MLKTTRHSFRSDAKSRRLHTQTHCMHSYSTCIDRAAGARVGRGGLSHPWPHLQNDRWLVRSEPAEGPLDETAHLLRPHTSIGYTYRLTFWSRRPFRRAVRPLRYRKLVQTEPAKETFSLAAAAAAWVRGVLGCEHGVDRVCTGCEKDTYRVHRSAAGVRAERRVKCGGVPRDDMATCPPAHELLSRRESGVFRIGNCGVPRDGWTPLPTTPHA